MNRGRAIRPRAIAVTLVALLGGCNTSSSRMPADGPVRELIESPHAIQHCSLSPDSRHLAYLDADGTLHVFDVLLDRSVGEIELAALEPRVAAMGTRHRFAIAGPQGIEVRIVTGGIEALLQPPPAPVAFMLFDARSEYLVVAEVSGAVRVLEIATGKVVREFSPPADEGGWRVAPGAGFGVLFVHQDGRTRSVPCGPDQSGRRHDLRVTPGGQNVLCEDGTAMALATDAGMVEVWSMTAAAPRASIPIADPVVGLALSPDGTALAIATGAGKVELWDVDAVERLDALESQASPDGRVAFSPDGSFLSWVEAGRSAMRFWFPSRAALRWTAGGREVRSEARAVCRTDVSLVRFRLAATPFDAGVAALARREHAAALESFEAANRVFPPYPGLADKLIEARARHLADLLPEQLQELQSAGRYREALGRLDEFLAAYARFDEVGFAGRAVRLREMLAHLDKAEQHRAAGREVDAVLSFESAAAIEPDLVRHHPDYPALRRRLTAGLLAKAAEEQKNGRSARVVELLGQLARLTPLSSASLLDLGTAHEALGEAVPAETAWSAVAAETPHYAPARRGIARLASAAGEHQKARAQLELARRAAPGRADLEKEYATACEQCGDLDAAVAIWTNVAQLEPNDAAPFETIARLESGRQRWQQAAIALRQAIGRSTTPQPKRWLEVADLFLRAGQREQVFAAYLEVLALVDKEASLLAFLGPAPRRTIENKIRALDYVHHRDEWLPREQLLLEQGWVRSGDDWLRPDEVQLRDVAKRYAGAESLRVLSEDRYPSYVEQQRIGKGMTRREVIAAWGFFEDMNVLRGAADAPVFEQLLFDDARRVYLKDGLVCFWTE